MRVMFKDPLVFRPTLAKLADPEGKTAYRVTKGWDGTAPNDTAVNDVLIHSPGSPGYVHNLRTGHKFHAKSAVGMTVEVEIIPAGTFLQIEV